MDYIQLLQKRINSISESNIESMLFEEFFNLEDKIADLNLKQIERSKGFDDKELYSSQFSGYYSETTQGFADRNDPYPSLTKKTGGEKYNFLWSGDFARGFGIRKTKLGIETFSEGAYSSRTLGKTSFFQSYENMFGLNSENTATIENEVLYYVFEKTLNNIYK